MTWIEWLKRSFSFQAAGNLDHERLFIALAFGFVSLGWLALTLAETRLFHWLPLSIGILLLVAVSLLHLRLYRDFNSPSKVELAFLLFAIGFATWSALLFHDTFYGGRDPGVFANAAVYLSREGDLVVNRFVNYPGWISANGFFTVNFDIAYIAWLGTFHSLGGLAAMKFGNVVPVFVAMMAVYFVGKRLANELVGGLALFGISTTYPLLWFVRGSYNEIFFMALVWFGILCLLVAWQKRSPGYLLPGMLSLGLAMHTRLEGILVFLAVLFILPLLYLRTRTSRAVGLASVVLVLSIVAHYLFYVQVTQPHYLQAHTSALTAILRTFGVASPSSGVPANPDAVRHHFPAFVYTALSAYHLAWPLLFIPVATLMALWGIRQKRSIHLLAVLAILAPSLIYLRIPFVSLDQPWFLKRYLAIIIPLGFLCTSIVVFKVLSRPLLVAPLALLIVSLNLATASPIAFHQEYDGMIDFVEDLSKVFSEEDLVLVDRFATGNYKLADPLFFVFGRQTLWVSSSSEFLDHLDREGSTLQCRGNAFYVTSANSPLHRVIETVPKDSIELVWSRTVKFQELKATVDLVHYPGRPPDTYDMDYNVVESLVEVPRDVVSREYSVMVYRVDLGRLDLGGEARCVSG